MGLRRAISCSLLIAVVLLTTSLPLSLGQMCCSPCNVVDNFAGPPAVQAGKPFTVVSFLTVWCYLLPRIRVDLVDATSYQILSSATFLVQYSTSGVYVISIANNATARFAPGSWSLEVRAYAIDAASGFPVGQWLQMFQILVLPYPPQGTTQAIDTPTPASVSISFISTQPTLPFTRQQIATGTHRTGTLPTGPWFK